MQKETAARNACRTKLKYRRWARPYHSQVIRDDIRIEYLRDDVDNSIQVSGVGCQQLNPTPPFSYSMLVYRKPRNARVETSFILKRYPRLPNTCQI